MFYTTIFFRPLKISWRRRRRAPRPHGRDATGNDDEDGVFTITDSVAAVYTSVAVGLPSVSVLKSGRPGSLVLGDGRLRPVAHSVPSHGALRPLAAVRPPPAPLDAQAVTLALHPLPGELAAVRPRVDAARLEAGLPGPRVLAFLVRSGADAVAVGATLVRAAAVRAAVVEVEMADGRRGRRRCGRWLRRHGGGLVGRRRTAGGDGTPRAMNADRRRAHSPAPGDHIVATLPVATRNVVGPAVRVDTGD